MTRFRAILVANRGEIACRVLRTARSLGYRTVAVFSDADRDQPHVRLADAALRIGPAPAGQSYLSIDAIIEAARACGADAIHPGYGFLSENPAFAEACAAAGIAFIGPPAEAMRAMGGKAEAKAIMRAAGVPVAPGYDGADQSDARLIAEAEAAGFPVMVKASAGGGGRGMRLVQETAALPAALASARAEAKAGFGDDRLLIEKAIARPRHVEIQIMADSHGHAIHLGERDCSIQRRHQKLIEEAPAVDAGLREAMGAAAVACAKAVGYVGAGTVEFLLDAQGNYFFLEMNTRLQVEHPVTEAITGFDLVALQIAVAEGRPLALRQEDVRFRGHAIEARLCAEDAANGFLPATGRLLAFSSASGARTDSGVETGSEVTPHYDSLVAKVIAHGATREEARAKLIDALKRTTAFGVVTNRDFLLSALDHDLFVQGRATTAFIAEAGEDLRAATVGDDDLALAAALFAGQGDERPSPQWRATPLKLEAAGGVYGLTVRRNPGSDTPTPGPSPQGGGEKSADLPSHLRGGAGGGGQITVEGLAQPRAIEIRSIGGETVRVVLDGVERTATFARDRDTLWLDAGRIVCVRDVTYAAPGRADDGGDGAVAAPMTGTVARVLVGIGDRVRRGDLLLVVEAMKMEHMVVAAIDGVVESLSAAPGQQVAARTPLASIRAEEAT